MVALCADLVALGVRRIRRRRAVEQGVARGSLKRLSGAPEVRAPHRWFRAL